MWHVLYERHEWVETHKISRYSSPSFLKAWAVFQAWDCCYVFSILPVKRVMFYKSEDGIPVLSSVVSKSRNIERLPTFRNKKS